MFSFEINSIIHIHRLYEEKRSHIDERVSPNLPLVLAWICLVNEVDLAVA